MESTVTTSTITTLKLNEKEAAWLKALMQNPMSDDPIDVEMSKSFWKALHGDANPVQFPGTYELTELVNKLG